jgi:hypothetical protein
VKYNTCRKKNREGKDRRKEDKMKEIKKES